MGRGLAPDPDLGRVWPVLRYLSGRRVSELPGADAGAPAPASAPSAA
jgi:hypothetical protein